MVELRTPDEKVARLISGLSGDRLTSFADLFPNPLYR